MYQIGNVRLQYDRRRRVSRLDMSTGTNISAHAGAEGRGALLGITVPYLAKVTSESVAAGLPSFFTSRIFLGGNGHFRNSRSRGLDSVAGNHQRACTRFQDREKISRRGKRQGRERTMIFTEGPAGKLLKGFDLLPRRGVAERSSRAKAGGDMASSTARSSDAQRPLQAPMAYDSHPSEGRPAQGRQLKTTPLELRADVQCVI